jgi:type II restriction/modification system DNA methylase subunit YeeA
LRPGRQQNLFNNLPRQKRVRELDVVRKKLRDANANVMAARDLAKKLRDEFLLRLRNFRVLDPACGSGNFLYVALRALKDIEHKANIDAEALGLDKASPAVGPECVLGIELNPYAAELARVSVWIGEIQWMRRNGFDAAKNPILRTLDTIECRDAVLNADGTRAVWPAADVVVGNPPFLGGSKMLDELGDDYAKALRGAWNKVPGAADLVCYWFAKAWDQMAAGKLQNAGFVATNSIRGGANREVLKPIVNNARIFEAWSDEPWTVDGAAVRVSLVCFDKQTSSGVKLNGQSVNRILSD